MSTKVITPTVGRKVWLRLNGRGVEGLTANDSFTPMDATVVYVWHDRMVNLAARDHNGSPFSITSVPLLQEGDVAPRDTAYCEWMPYQKSQAEKAAASAEGDFLTGKTACDLTGEAACEACQ